MEGFKGQKGAWISLRHVENFLVEWWKGEGRTRSEVQGVEMRIGEGGASLFTEFGF